jgi:hypothetical protein
MKARFALLSGLIGLLPIVDIGRAEPITTGSLLREMIELKRLAEFPNPTFGTVQFSSSDRRSNLPAGPGWYANSDGFGNEPIPNFQAVVREPDNTKIGEYLVCDVPGPGAIVRVWTAAISGTVRLYLDGADTPVFNGPAEDFFLKPYLPFLKEAGLEEALFDGSYQQRQACYFPIPFAKHCRITWAGNPQAIHFYEVQVRLYNAEAEVTTFTPKDLVTYRKPIEEVARILKNPDETWPEAAGGQSFPIAATIPPRESRTVLDLKGPHAVERLTLQLHAADLDRALRQTMLHISFDGHPWAQVQCPVGDFFGAAPGVNPYQSIPFTVRTDGTMTCRFFMPFAKSIQLRLENRGEQPANIAGSARLAAYAWNEQSSMHFRARWRVEHGLVNSAAYDLPFLIANGQGVYVGTASILMNPCPVPTSGGNWWGEGDEKIFVDDDRLPSIFGTGSEDYYNYAWSAPDIFLFPYCGQPRNDGPDNRGFVTNNRWHILDAIPFRNRLSFYMEFYSHERTPGYSYARIGYHYARPGLMDDHVPATDDDLKHLELAPWQPAPRGAARNALFFQTEELAPRRPDVVFEQDNLYAGGKLFVWQPARKGDELVVPLPVAEKGNYVIGFTARLNAQSGMFSARLDDQPLDFGRSVLSLHEPHRNLLRNFLAKPLELEPGPHPLKVRFEGSPPGAEGTSIGLDFIWLQKQ